MPDNDHVDEEIDRELGWDKGRASRLRRAAADPVSLRIARSLPARAALAVCRSVFRVVFFPVFSASGFHKSFDINGNEIQVKNTFLRRFFDGMMVRALITPVILAVFLLAVVWQTTHPRPVLATQTPAAMGMYFERVSINSTDGQEINAWCIPPMTADEIVAQGEAAMGRRYPAVVLAHGLGFSHEQYLGLAQQLHQAGRTVLMLDTRGQGESPTAPVTFGVRERFDIIAAVNYARGLPYTDSTRLAVMGYGDEGAAALQAAALDSSIGVVIADAVRPSFADQSNEALNNPWIPSKFLAPPYQATFELVMREHLDLLNLPPVVSSIHHAAIMFIARPQSSGDPRLQEVAGLASLAVVPHQVLTCAPRVEADGKLRPQEAAQITQFVCKNLQWTLETRSPAVDSLLDARVK